MQIPDILVTGSLQPQIVVNPGTPESSAPPTPDQLGEHRHSLSEQWSPHQRNIHLWRRNSSTDSNSFSFEEDENGQVRLSFGKAAA